MSDTESHKNFGIAMRFIFLDSIKYARQFLPLLSAIASSWKIEPLNCVNSI